MRWSVRLRAFALRFLDDEVQLAALRRVDNRQGTGAERTFEYTPIARAPVALGSLPRFLVQLDVREGGIELELAGTRIRFAAPKERSGFFGVALRGPGLVGVRNIKLGS